MTDQPLRDALEPCPLSVGERVFVNADLLPREYAHDWREVEATISGISFDASFPGGYNIEISEVWPPKSNGDRTDGFKVHELISLATPAPAPTMDQGEVERAAIPRDIAEQVLSMGRVEWGATARLTEAGHLEHLARSLRLTREHFNYEDVPVAMHGLYLEGTETVLAHTGTSPNSAPNAQALAGAWNWLHEQSEATIAAQDGCPFKPKTQEHPSSGSVGEDVVERAIMAFVADCTEDEQQLPAIQFIANRADLLARAAIASIPDVPEGLRERIVHEAQFLVDRISGDLEWTDIPDDFVRDWNGHVDPPLSRLTRALEEYRSVLSQDGEERR